MPSDPRGRGPGHGCSSVIRDCPDGTGHTVTQMVMVTVIVTELIHYNPSLLTVSQSKMLS